MPVGRPTLNRTTAALLPVAFLWGWTACAVICGQETAEAGGHTPAAAAAELTAAKGAPVCEGCPFVAFPKAATPERAAFDDGPQTAAADVPPALPAQPPTAAFVRPRGQAPAAPPPLRLLPTLRI